ncbi:lon [Symbiodinium natans]|uniref:Lon protein n=1 Tax=Symbiodinium natans TaxID=878477 RepID=A0A812JED1_9DINO|nr:lon [Symbiodinium natans]
MASATRTDIFILALRQQVIFPAMRATVTVSQDTFAELCDFCEKHQRTHIACITMAPNGDLHKTGTWCRIASHQQNTTKFQDHETTVISLSMEGQCRLQVESFTQKVPFHVGNVRLLEEVREHRSSECMGDSPELVPTEIATDLGTDGFTDAESAEMELPGTLAMPPFTDGRSLLPEENAAAANVFAPNAPSPFVGLGAPQIHMYRQQFQQNITIGTRGSA